MALGWSRSRPSHAPCPAWRGSPHRFVEPNDITRHIALACGFFWRSRSRFAGQERARRRDGHRFHTRRRGGTGGQQEHGGKKDWPDHVSLFNVSRSTGATSPSCPGTAAAWSMASRIDSAASARARSCAKAASAVAMERAARSRARAFSASDSRPAQARLPAGVPRRRLRPRSGNGRRWPFGVRLSPFAAPWRKPTCGDGASPVPCRTACASIPRAGMAGPPSACLP